jgi:hypothetical protein
LHHRNTKFLRGWWENPWGFESPFGIIAKRTARHYADLAPGARETPTILERYVSEDSAERKANRMRTEASAAEASEDGCA